MLFDRGDGAEGAGENVGGFEKELGVGRDVGIGNGHGTGLGLGAVVVPACRDSAPLLAPVHAVSSALRCGSLFAPRCGPAAIQSRVRLSDRWGHREWSSSLSSWPAPRNRTQMYLLTCLLRVFDDDRCPNECYAANVRSSHEC